MHCMIRVSACMSLQLTTSMCAHMLQLPWCTVIIIQSSIKRSAMSMHQPQIQHTHLPLTPIEQCRSQAVRQLFSLFALSILGEQIVFPNLL